MRFKEFLLLESGQPPGQHEVLSTGVHTAMNYAKSVLGDSFHDIYPNFKQNYIQIKKLAARGWALRREMPVVEAEQVAFLSKVLNTGHFSNEEAVKLMAQKLGIRERVRASHEHQRLSKLHPIQKQLYLDKVIPPIAQYGVDSAMKFFRSAELVIGAKERKIIDGHHRWLGAALLDCEMVLPCLYVNLYSEKLLPLTINFGMYMGNQPNL